MIFINSTFNTRKVREFVADLISDYDYKSYEDISHSDKCQFANHLMEAAGKRGENECLLESNDLDLIIYSLKKSLSGGSHADQNLLFTLKDSVIRYYNETMELIFDDVLADKIREDNEWLDYISTYGDPDEGYDYQRSML